MIGIYNYTVIVTYLSLVSAALGMVFSSQGNFKAALICLLVSGLCDMLDGPIARTKKRTETEKKFGIQIDSLCDCISFGIQPAVFIYCMTVAYSISDCLRIVSLVISIAFSLCAVIRLAYFNVTEEERQQTEGNKKRTGYQGLPVTNIALILPCFSLVRFVTDGNVFAIIMNVVLAVTAFLFVLNFRMIKLHGKKLIPVVLVGVAILVGLIMVEF